MANLTPIDITGVTLNINDMLDVFESTDDFLTYNAIIEREIKNQGGSILYKNSNILIASEISENFYKELQKNPYIDFIEDLPLKKFGMDDTTNTQDIIDDILNINQNNNENNNGNKDVSGDDASKTVDDIINNKNDEQSEYEKNGVIEIDGVTIVGDISAYGVNTDGLPGFSEKKPLPTTGTTPNQKGIPPIITNEETTLSGGTNVVMTLNITATGTLPIKYEMTKPKNFEGIIDLQNNKLTVISKKMGLYIITLKAINAYGSYTKDITVNISDSVKITNTNLNVKNRTNSTFSYSIESSGSLPKTYSMIIEPTGSLPNLVLQDNIISGITTEPGEFDIKITVSGLTSSDTKTLKLRVGSPPIITSSGILSGATNNYIQYVITALNTEDIVYNISGELNNGLTFKTDTIDGTPTLVGLKNIVLKATNPFGESTKNLTITIYEMET